MKWKKFASLITPDISAELGTYSGIKRCDHYPRSDWPKRVTEAWTYGTEMKGSGNLSILIIGNSHAECQTPGIQLAMDGLYSKLSFVAIAGVTPFEGFPNSGAWFVFQNAVKHYKPDIIFLMFKYQTDFEDPLTDTDYHMMKVQEMITFLANSSKVVFISGPHFDIPKFYSIKFTEMIFNHGWIKDFKINQEVSFMLHYVTVKYL
uniref:SGNH domain-containing protein n=1 Tax=Panagrolaimus sp. ES5 TaxID=591445 RepID=A0AC34FTX1_9BILA